MTHPQLSSCQLQQCKRTEPGGKGWCASFGCSSGNMQPSKAMVAPKHHRLLPADAATRPPCSLGAARLSSLGRLALLSGRPFFGERRITSLLPHASSRPSPPLLLGCSGPRPVALSAGPTGKPRATVSPTRSVITQWFARTGGLTCHLVPAPVSSGHTLKNSCRCKITEKNAVKPFSGKNTRDESRDGVYQAPWARCRHRAMVSQSARTLGNLHPSTPP